MSAATTEDVACTIKPPVFLGFRSGTRERPSGVCVVDVVLPPGKTVDIERISFKNFYTAFLSIRLQRRSPGREGAPAKWCTALRDCPLMKNPHTEGGAHDYYNLHRKQLQVSADEVSCVRLILKQPSWSWSSFGVEDVRVYPRAPPPEPDKELSEWLLALETVDPPVQVGPGGGRGGRVSEPPADVGTQPSHAGQSDLHRLRRTLRRGWLLRHSIIIADIKAVHFCCSVLV
ncbi:nicolin-1 isoform X2 [Corythoichthys intestinalis]|uniref:nicolin-1 isoform X2 n=1 Tax=Corythoichthys intestinalis TaxID=161448 RepID=UPI0025A661BF|nr:nicolin-1 isoform X2 [Corythoichthys intestinalis]